MNPLRRPAGRPEVIAHRGASAHAPENTMPAFRRTWATGGTWIECDVQPTADNEFVLLHDDDVTRTTNGTGLIRELHRAQWQTLDAGSWWSPDYAGTPIPLLTDLLTALPTGQLILLEIKGTFTPHQIQALLTQLAASGVDDRVFLESFDLPALAEIHARQPDRPLGVLVDQWPDDPIGLCRQLGARSFNPRHALLTDRPDALHELHHHDLALWPWTVDDPHEWQRLTAAGIDGLITNRPAELVQFVANTAPPT